jgi:glycosyltransferase involved in cell wall biosynthesis
MKASVAICTHNRAEDLKEALLSLLRQSFRDSYEILVVDNGSTDHTRQVVQEFQKMVSVPVRYVFEKRLGLSVARNRAIREASGEYVLFLDDDAIASEHWIGEIVSLFERDPRIGCVGGKIEPVWEGGAPKWLPQENRTLYTILDYADEVVEMREPAVPFGANIAFRKAIFETMEPFREDLGRVGGTLLSGEESELIERIRRGYAVYYTPRAWVLHKIPRSRASRRWLLRRIYWQGVSRAVSSRRKAGLFVLSLLKVPVFLLLAIVFLYDRRRIFRNISKIAYNNGLIRGVLRAHR